jgi:hypothetical protein
MRYFLILLFFWASLFVNGQGLIVNPYRFSGGGGGGGGGGTVAFDARTTNLQNASSSTTTFSHTVTGSNPALVVFVALTGTAQTVSSITYNGVSLTSIGTVNDTLGATKPRLEAWGLSGPATGAHNVVVTLSAANSGWDAIAVSFTGTAGSGTFDGFQSAIQSGAGTSVTVTVTTGDTGDMVVDCTASCADNGTTSGSGQTQRWQDNSGTSNTQGSTKAGGASVAMSESWDNSTDGKVLVGINVNHN